MKTAEEKFMHDWGAELWEYFDKVGYYDKTDMGMRVELKQLLKKHAIEFKNYVQENYGYTDRAFTVPDSAYDEWIESKE